MSIKTKLEPMGGSSNNSNHILTVITNPDTATCTLTYNGTSYKTKQVTVQGGTVVSYSVYHSTYGTTTGTITMDSDKTLNCVGASSTSTGYYVNDNLLVKGSTTIDNNSSYASNFSANNHIDTKSTSASLMSKTNWEAKVRFKCSTTTSSYQYIMGGRVSGNDGYGIFVYLYKSTLWVAVGTDGSASRFELGSKSISTNTWYTVTFGYKNGTYFCNGDISYSGYYPSNQTTWDSSYPVILGTRSDGNYPGSYITVDLKNTYLLTSSGTYLVYASQRTTYYWSKTIS